MNVCEHVPTPVPSGKPARKITPKLTSTQIRAIENVDALVETIRRLDNEVTQASHHRVGSHEAVFLGYVGWLLSAATMLYNKSRELGLPLYVDEGVFGSRSPRLCIGKPPADWRLTSTHRTHEPAQVIKVDFQRKRRA